MIPLIHISADEVNHIIYSYLLDSGFLHTAYVLRTEGRLEQSPHFDDHVSRGELVELLTKALLYTEVETHCKGDGLITDCRNPFSLLKRHVCAIDLMEDEVNGSQEASGQQAESNGISDSSLKRKADGPVDGDRHDRRLKRSIELDAAESSSANLLESSASIRRDLLVTPNSERDSTPMSVAQSGTRVNEETPTETRPRECGPADDKTDPKAALCLTGHTSEVFVCAWNPMKPEIIATGSKDATIRIWDLPDPPEELSKFAEAPQESPIVLNYCTSYEFDNDQDQRDITSLDWNEEGTLLAAGSFDSTLRVWTTNGDLYLISPHHRGPIFATRFSHSGTLLLTGSLDGTACVWDMVKKRLRMQIKCHDEYCLDVDWLNEDTFATCGADRLINIIRVGIQEPLRTLHGHTDEVNQIKFNPSKTRLASCSDDYTARIWTIGKLPSHPDPLTLNQSDNVVVLNGHTDKLGGIKWCPIISEGSHEMVATISFDGTARLWDAMTGDCLRAFSDHRGAVYTLSFSPEGKYLATGSGDGWLHIYDVKARGKVWSWYAGADKHSIYEIDWQKTGQLDRLAMCLESSTVGIIDVTRIPVLNGTA